MKVWTTLVNDNSEYDDGEYTFFHKYGYLTCNHNHPHVLANDEDDTLHQFKIAYNWISSKLKEKIYTDCNLVYPRWVWYMVGGSTNISTINKCFYNHTIGKYVILIFDIPEEYILLNDYYLWHHCLNLWPIHTSEKQAEQFSKELNNYHLKYSDIFNYNLLKNNKLSNVILNFRNYIINSWNEIFNINEYNDYINYEEKTIQGITWILEKKYFIDEIHYEITKKDLKEYDK